MLTYARIPRCSPGRNRNKSVLVRSSFYFNRLRLPKAGCQSVRRELIEPCARSQTERLQSQWIGERGGVTAAAAGGGRARRQP